MDGEVLYAKAFIEVGDSFGDGVDDVGDFIADDKLDVLSGGAGTFAAS